MTFEPATPAGMGPITIHTDTMPDVIGLSAAERCRQIANACGGQVADLHLLIPDFSERQEVNTAKYGAEKRLERLQNHPQNGGFDLADDDPRVREARARSQKACCRSAADQRPLRTMRSQAWNTAGQVLSQVQAWLTDGKPAGVVLKDFTPDPSRNLARTKTSPTPSRDCAIVAAN